VFVRVRASYELDYWRLYPPVLNDTSMRTGAFCGVRCDRYPVGIVPECQTMGGEDMSFFLQAVPGCWLAVCKPRQNLAYPHHHPI